MGNFAKLGPLIEFRDRGLLFECTYNICSLPFSIISRFRQCRLFCPSRLQVGRDMLCIDLSDLALRIGKKKPTIGVIIPEIGQASNSFAYCHISERQVSDYLRRGSAPTARCLLYHPTTEIPVDCHLGDSQICQGLQGKWLVDCSAEECASYGLDSLTDGIRRCARVSKLGD